jgi:cholesterol oxidase
MSIETQRWSEPIETLLEAQRADKVCDVLIIGSGYGGSFAARELAGAGDVWVVERGREYALGEFPEDIGSLPGNIRFSRRSKPEITGRPDSLFDLRLFDDLAVLLANGLGGGSLINAGVALKPDPETLRAAGWPTALLNGRQGELDGAMDEVLATLRAAPLKDAASLAKYQALAELAARAGCEAAQPAPVTIASDDGTTPTGLPQRGCTRCGNCFTGCNVGAKNTLVSHVIPDAARRGVRFFTGATALSVAPSTDGAELTDTGRPVRWVVNFTRTVNAKGNPEQQREFWIYAHAVILAAGTLGSTELLLRSKEITRSPRLGHRFSTNGDVIAMGWGMKPPVKGISAARPASTGPSNDVGPTIAGMARATLDVNGKKVVALLQDGAIPSALAQVGITLGSALSLAHRYTEDAVPEAFPPGSDPLALPAHIGEHALLVFGIGSDPATGVMSLRKKSEALLTHRVAGKMKIEWPEDKKNPRAAYQLAFDAMLSQSAAAGGFQGGDYLASPGWRPFPSQFNTVSGDPPHKSITVHPLGGCPMGNDGSTGVVDWKGAVFSGSGTDLHEGLFVMDGAMVPSALGVNPFVTISALSVMAARQLRAQLAQDQLEARLRPCRPLPQVQPGVVALAFQAAGPIKMHFEERLQGSVAGDAPQWFTQLVKQHAQDVPPFSEERAGWVARVTVDIVLHDWLADPSIALPASMELFRNGFQQELSVQDEALRGKPVLLGKGTVRLLALDAPAHDKEMKRRGREALLTYLSRRSTRDLMPLSGSGDRAAMAAFLRARRNHALQRVLGYEFLLGPGGDAPADIVARGEKRLAYGRQEKNVWDALTQLDLKLAHPGGQGQAELRLKVDLVDLVKKNRLQIVEAPNSPAVMIGLAAFASTWLRAVVTTHFWSFRGSNSESTQPLPPAQHGLLRPNGLAGPAIPPERYPLCVRESDEAPDTIDLELTTYQPQGGGNGEHVLLIHGLAHGGGVFTTDTVGYRNMATAFLADGYQVWILDHRLSNRLGHKLQSHTMDDLARHDIPDAVRYVYEKAGRPIKVFAHCVGAGAFSMAALTGELRDEKRECRSMVEKAVIHAVHPWIVASPTNQLSAAVAALYKDLIDEEDPVDPLPAREPGIFDQLVDRFAASIPWADRELTHHELHKYHVHGGCAVCNRMTLFYGREWVHGNLSETTHQQLAGLVGPASISVFRQLYFLMLRERLTSSTGENTYMTRPNLQNNFDFPVLFCHGRENKVFDPRSAVQSWHRLSRLRAGARQGVAVDIFIADGYGHMDFLFGKDAHRDIFPKLLQFLNSDEGYDGGWRWRDNAPPVPPRPTDWEISDFRFRPAKSILTGPMLQLQTVEGKRQVVLWLEQRQDPMINVDAPVLRAAGQACTQTGGDCLQWAAEKLPVEASPDSSQDDSLGGAGVFWVGTLTERIDGEFRAMGPLRLELVSEKPDATTPAAAPAARLAGAGEPGFVHPLRWWVPSVYVTPPLTAREIDERARLEAVLEYQEEIVPMLDWSGLAWWRRWLGEPVATPVSWLATSCRWPGLPFEREAPDKLALEMQQHVTGTSLPVDALLLLGDQIYADATADVADTTEPVERGAQRYRDAWGAEHTRKLLASVPTYMVLDDHEYKDGWNGAEDPSLDKDFANGFQAARAFQWRWNRPKAEHPTITGGSVRGFWREFSIGNVPAFAADTRSERPATKSQDWRLANMMSDGQADAIEAWLGKYRDVPKILCSGSVFGFPEEELIRDPLMCQSADGWFGFPRSWQRICAFIGLHQIHNLVFLSGDYHLSAIAELQIEAVGARAPVRALSVVCSGWNATLPFANRRERDIRTGVRVRAPLSGPEVDLWSTSHVLSTALRQFSKLTLVPAGPGWELQVRVYGPRKCELASTSRRL